MDGGAAKEGEAYEEGVGAVGVGADFALKATEVASDYADGVVYSEFGRCKFNRGVRLAEHEFQFLYFSVANDSYRFVETTGICRTVHKKTIDLGKINDSTACFLSAFHKYH